MRQCDSPVDRMLSIRLCNVHPRESRIRLLAGGRQVAGRVAWSVGSVGVIVERVVVGRGWGGAAPLALAAVVVKILLGFANTLDIGPHPDNVLYVQPSQRKETMSIIDGTETLYTPYGSVTRAGGMTRPPRPTGYAGLRSTRWNRLRETWVSVYDGDPAGMDTDGGRWQTVCEKHGSVCQHLTIRVATIFASSPDEWCEDCSQPNEMRPPREA